MQNFCLKAIYRTAVCKTNIKEGFSQTEAKVVYYFRLAEGTLGVLL
jgi:hypothetical protein